MLIDEYYSEVFLKFVYCIWKESPVSGVKFSHLSLSRPFLLIISISFSSKVSLGILTKSESYYFFPLMELKPLICPSDQLIKWGVALGRRGARGDVKVRWNRTSVIALQGVWRLRWAIDARKQEEINTCRCWALFIFHLALHIPHDNCAVTEITQGYLLRSSSVCSRTHPRTFSSARGNYFSVVLRNSSSFSPFQSRSP